MKKEELKDNMIVKINKGQYGTVTSFNGKPFQIVFSNFTNPVDKWADDLTRVSGRTNNYDIEEIYDGSSIKNPISILQPKFTPEGLPLLWKR